MKIHRKSIESEQTNRKSLIMHWSTSIVFLPKINDHLTVEWKKSIEIHRKLKFVLTWNNFPNTRWCRSCRISVRNPSLRNCSLHEDPLKHFSLSINVLTEISCSTLLRTSMAWLTSTDVDDLPPMDISAEILLIVENLRWNQKKNIDPVNHWDIFLRFSLFLPDEKNNKNRFDFQENFSYE